MNLPLLTYHFFPPYNIVLPDPEYSRRADNPRAVRQQVSEPRFAQLCRIRNSHPTPSKFVRLTTEV
jgi:hypothetical protein